MDTIDASYNSRPIYSSLFAGNGSTSFALNSFKYSHNNHSDTCSIITMDKGSPSFAKVRSMTWPACMHGSGLTETIAHSK